MTSQVVDTIDHLVLSSVRQKCLAISREMTFFSGRKTDQVNIWSGFKSIYFQGASPWISKLIIPIDCHGHEEIKAGYVIVVAKICIAQLSMQKKFRSDEVL